MMDRRCHPPTACEQFSSLLYCPVRPALEKREERIKVAWVTPTVMDSFAFLSFSVSVYLYFCLCLVVREDDETDRDEHTQKRMGWAGCVSPLSFFLLLE